MTSEKHGVKGVDISPLNHDFNNMAGGLGIGSTRLCARISEFVAKMKDPQDSSISRLRESLNKQHGSPNLGEMGEQSVVQLQDEFLKAQKLAAGDFDIPKTRRNWMGLSEQNALESVEMKRERLRLEMAKK